MQTVEIQTSLGVVPITGKFRDGSVAVLIITGAFAHPSELINAPDLFAPDFGAYVARLPGNGTPPLSEVSIDAFVQAFDEVAARLGKPVVAHGISVGGLVALAMRSPCRIVAVDPRLSTGRLWPLNPGLREQYWPEHRQFLSAVFGMRDVGRVAKRYHHLVDRLTAQTDVVVGSERLHPRRPITRIPSLVDDEDRAFLIANSQVTLHVAPNAGRNIPNQPGRFLHNIAVTACRLAHSSSCISPTSAS
jgi:hypothetical protein